MTATPSARLDAIVEQGLCIGCGLCQPLSNGAVRMTTTPAGALRPRVTGSLDHPTVDRIYDTCPGTRIDGLDPSTLTPQTLIDPVWGPWLRAVLAWAADPVVRHEGSTGGVLTALARYLLRSGRVAFILHTRASTTHPTFGQATISRTEDEVLAAAGSRYGPTATLVGIAEVLDRGEPFAFIGKPCDVAALNSLGRHDDRIRNLVRYRLAPVCGGYGPTTFTEGFLRRMGIAPTAVTAFRYRGRGCPGPTTATTADDTVEAHYLDYWGDDETQWQLPWRCKICPDGIGESADIVAADTWPGGSPDRKASTTDPGTNAVVTRTADGDELLNAAVAADAVELGAAIGIDDLNRFQPHQWSKKRAVHDRFAGLADEGRIVPTTTDLRLARLASTVPVAIRAEQRAGTRARIAAGSATEPPA